MKQIPRILVADDSPTITGILSYFFEQEGWQVDTAGDGVEALNQFYKSPPDLVILDIEMPRMNGYQVCRLLKDNPVTRKIPIIILTSRDMQSDRFRGIAAGADAYLVKNLESDQILLTARQLLDDSDENAGAGIEKHEINEAELLQTVNRMLDQRLFSMTVNDELVALNSRVENLDDVITEIVLLLSRVFEFVVGGVVLLDNEKPIGVLSVLDGFDKMIADDFGLWLFSEACHPDKSTLQPEYKTLNHTGNPHLFPSLAPLAHRISLPLISRNKRIGALGIAGTAPLKFTPESEGLLEQLIGRAAIVIDNANLVSKLSRSNSELSKTLTKLKSTQIQLVLSEKMALLGQMTAGLVHEINNPLNFISGNVDLLGDYVIRLDRLIKFCFAKYGSEIPEDIRNVANEIELDYLQQELPSLIDDIRLGATRTREIIRDLRVFAVPDSGNRSPSDLASIISSTVNILRNQWQNVCEIREEYAELPPYECIGGLIGQAIMNIVSNAILAIKATGRGGTVEITLRESDKHVEIKVRDNGVGIPPENRDKLFQPFFTTRDVGKGMGLGLSITHSIIQQHGGKIDVESEVGKGSTFTIRLPSEHLTGR